MTDERKVPSLRTDVDMSRVSLNAEEGFILSRVDGRATDAEIAMIVGKALPEMQSSLRVLANKGLINYEDAKSKVPNGQRIPSSFIFPVGLMQEAGDLDVATRKRIIWVHENLDKWTHYELLEVERRASREEIKKGYRERTKDWHPDRFQRKKLGSFKKMVEVIFKRLTEAQKVLTNAESRLEYDRTVVFEPSDEELKEIIWEAKRTEREARRKEEAEQRRVRKNPMLAKKAQAREFFDQAKAAEAEGNLTEAKRAAQMAQAYDSKNEEYSAYVDWLASAASEQRIGPLLKRAKQHETMTQWEEAIMYLEEAVRVAPQNGDAHLRLSYNYLMGRHPLDDVLRHAHKAVALIPTDPEAHYILGRCFEAKEMMKNAKKHYEEALRIKSNYQEAKKRLSKLKWGF